MDWLFLINSGPGFADPDTALRDVRETHRWASQECETAPPGSTREYNLKAERMRLSAINSALLHSSPEV
jgi:hypothetical protein